MVQVNPPHTTVRIKFRKVGDLQYVSHLDLVRTMQKVLARAGLSLWYTEGFNPKPKMVFSPPLSTGVESETEFLDVRLTEVPPLDELRARLNAVLTDELRVLDVYIPETKLTDIAKMSYLITVGGDFNLASAKTELEEFFARDEILIRKNSKRGEITVDIKPLIYFASVAESSGELHINCILSATPEAFLNPENLVKAIKDSTGVLNSPDLSREYYTVMRLVAYREDMTEFR